MKKMLENVVLEAKKAFEDVKDKNSLNQVKALYLDKNFSDNDKEIYRLLLKESDEIILLSEHYYNGCMIVRNKFMVDNSSVLLCYNRKNSGGAFYTLNYAKKCGLDIIEL